MAHVAPSKATSDVIHAIMTMWFSWAGAPGEMLVDAAVEFNSEEFMSFLQSHNIKCTTISPEAHFQNGKAERHGAVLGNMLTKFNSEHEIENWCIQAKNSSSLKEGFAPKCWFLVSTHDYQGQ